MSYHIEAYSEQPDPVTFVCEDPECRPVNAMEPNLRFGRLVAIRIVGRNKHRQAIWECLCDCGVVRAVTQPDLRSGGTRSCGCMLLEARHTNTVKHGQARKGKLSGEYTTWRSMRDRCLNPHNKNFPDYGGRGITVCERWLNSFQTFLEDMGPRPSAGHSINRINNDGPYSPDNCAWATRHEQGGNKRNNVVVTINGKVQTVAAWSVELGINRYTLYRRVQTGRDLLTGARI